MTAEEMWKRSGITGTYESWAFGGEPDKIADLVIKGIKTATCSLLALYEAENERIPEKGDYSIILDSKGEALCIIKTTRVYVAGFQDVTAEHAFKEGEGDRSLDHWRQTHRKFFSEELASIGHEFDPDNKLVCEEFQMVWKQDNYF